jgi:hypothetical protein
VGGRGSRRETATTGKHVTTVIPVKKNVRKRVGKKSVPPITTENNH